MLLLHVAAACCCCYGTMAIAETLSACRGGGGAVLGGCKHSAAPRPPRPPPAKPHRPLKPHSTMTPQPPPFSSGLPRGLCVLRRLQGGGQRQVLIQCSCFLCEAPCSAAAARRVEQPSCWLCTTSGWRQACHLPLDPCSCRASLPLGQHIHTHIAPVCVFQCAPSCVAIAVGWRRTCTASPVTSPVSGPSLSVSSSSLAAFPIHISVTLLSPPSLACFV